MFHRAVFWGTDKQVLALLPKRLTVYKIPYFSVVVFFQNNFEVSCHVLAHLAYIAFKIVPEALQENIIIILLDIFNQCLMRVSNEYMDQCLNYLQGICDMISRTELKLTMKTKMVKMFPVNVSR